MSILFSDFFVKNNEIRPQEAEFTEVLESIALTPKTLYFYGKIPQKRVKTVAIVGTRKFTKYGENVAYQLAYTLAKCGVVVISGLAYGIDSIGHRGALDAGGVTLAVLGTPINEIYPREHRGLAAEIVEKDGAVISELAPGESYYAKTCFLRRNRIIAGLADAVIVVEAAERSGSLNTAAHAVEQGKEVFAVPGDVTRPMSRGCNRLIAAGAYVCSGAEDVLAVLFPERVSLGRKKDERKFRRAGSSKRRIIQDKTCHDGNEFKDRISDTKTEASTISCSTAKSVSYERDASEADQIRPESHENALLGHTVTKAGYNQGRSKQALQDKQKVAKTAISHRSGRDIGTLAMASQQQKSQLSQPLTESGSDKNLEAENFQDNLDPEKLILKEIRSGKRGSEELFQGSGLEIADFNRLLMTLELNGQIRTTDGLNWYLAQ